MLALLRRADMGPFVEQSEGWYIVVESFLRYEPAVADRQSVTQLDIGQCDAALARRTMSCHED
jgi:hypothetical protein